MYWPDLPFSFFEPSILLPRPPVAILHIVSYFARAGTTRRFTRLQYPPGCDLAATPGLHGDAGTALHPVARCALSCVEESQERGSHHRLRYWGCDASHASAVHVALV